jgi:hypothetical protein
MESAQSRGANTRAFDPPVIPEAERMTIEIKHAVTYWMTEEGPIIAPGQVITKESDTTPPPGGQIPEDAPALLPPVNKDVPYLSGTPEVGQTLHITLGNWTGEPTTYGFQWQSDSSPVGTDNNAYVVVDVDSGHSIDCVVSATNAVGTTAAPPSNAVVIA